MRCRGFFARASIDFWDNRDAAIRRSRSWTGFGQTPHWLRRSPCARCCSSNRKAMLRSIACVTWDSAEIDSHVRAVSRGCRRFRWCACPSRWFRGSANQRGVACQIRNLDAALSQISRARTRSFSSCGRTSSSIVDLLQQDREFRYALRGRRQPNGMGRENAEARSTTQNLDTLGGFQISRSSMKTPCSSAGRRICASWQRR